MKVEEKNEYKLVLELNLEDAKILKGLVQNSHYIEVQDEPEDERNFREKLFNSIKLGYTGIR